MSRSNPNESLVNPATKFFQWSGDSGNFRYFDKSKGEKGEVVEVPISDKKPFTFLVLDTLATIKGYSDQDKSGFWSNEVRDLRKEILSVKTAKGPFATGLYENVSDKVKSAGGKFCQSVYIAVKGSNGELEIQNIQLVGAALSAWIEFCKTTKVMEVAIQVKSSHTEKKGKTVYHVPDFEAIKVSDKTNAEASELDKQLQEFLSEYLAKNSTTAVVSEKDVPEALKEPAKESKSTAKKEFNDLPFDKKESVDIVTNDEEETPPF